MTKEWPKRALWSTCPTTWVLLRLQMACLAVFSFFTTAPTGLNWIDNYTRWGRKATRSYRSAELTLRVIKIMSITNTLPNNPDRQENHSWWLKWLTPGHRRKDYVLGLAIGSVWLDLVVKKEKEGRKETVIEREQRLWETGTGLANLPVCSLV